jgi:hypothetical protein
MQQDDRRPVAGLGYVEPHPVRLHEAVLDAVDVGEVALHSRASLWRAFVGRLVAYARLSQLRAPYGWEVAKERLKRANVCSAVRLTFYRSNLRPQGAEYVPLAQKEL